MFAYPMIEIRDITRHESRPRSFLLSGQKAGPINWALRVKLVPSNIGVCFDHADSFEIDHFDQYFHLIFGLKVNSDTDFEAIVLEYDRYESPLGARSCHKYLVV